MDFDAIVLLFAAGWAVLSWLARAARGQRGELPEEPTVTTEDAEREVRRRQRMERLRARRTARSAPTAEAPKSGDEMAAEFQRELERLFGVPSSRPDHGPLGRRADTGLEGAEEVEELEVLEEEPEVVSIETSGERTERVLVDYDEGASELVRRRVAEAEARARALTKADHARFDQRIRSEPALVTPPAKTPWVRGRRPAGSLRDALIWSEILGPPVSERPASSRTDGGSW